MSAMIVTQSNLPQSMTGTAIVSGTAMMSGTGSKFITKGDVKERKGKNKWGASSSSVIGESSIIGESSSLG